MSKTVTVKLADREYIISKLHIEKSKVWRAETAVYLAELTSMIGMMYGTRDGSWGDIGAIAKIFSSKLLDAIDYVLELMYSYSPELAADKEYIEKNAYDDEALDAFIEVLKLAYPLGGLLALVAGQMANLTSSNSPSRSGASGTKPGSAVKANA